MTREKVILAVTCILGVLPIPVHGDVIFSNLGPGDSISGSNGWSIGYPFGPDEVGQSIAFSFMPTQDFELSSVEVAVRVSPGSTGSNEFELAIYHDSLTEPFGKPGTLLVSESGAAPIFSGAPESLTTVPISGAWQVVSGNRYWLGLHPAAAVPTDIGWWWNHDDDGRQSSMWQSNTPSEVLVGGSWEEVFTQTEAAFRINGTVIPEPTTMVTLSLIGGWLGTFRRRPTCPSTVGD